MRSRFVLLMALAIAAVAAVFAVSRFVGFFGSPATSLPSDSASYLGVYESGPPGTYQPVADFTSATGTQPNLVGYYSGWREPFQTTFAETVREHGAATILQWDPTGVSISAIAAGRYDGIALPETQERMAGRIKGAELQFFEGGHLFMLQDRAALPAIAAFLSRS